MLRCFGILLSVILVSFPVCGAQIWEIDDEEQAHRFRDGTGTYDNPIPIEDVVSIGAPVVDEEPQVPARLYKANGRVHYNFRLDWYTLDEDTWVSYPAPELQITLSPLLLKGQFLSNQENHIALASGGIGEITWEPKAINSTSGMLDLIGGEKQKTLRFEPESATDGRALPLSYKITIKSEPSLFATASMTQDAVDKLRQEYLDNSLKIPNRGSRWLSGSSIRMQADFLAKYQQLVTKYTAWVREKNKTVTVDLDRVIYSSTRTPYHNAREPNAESNSVHQYGLAYDLTPIPSYGGNANKQSDDADKIHSIWRDSLRLVQPAGHSYIASGGNKVHIQLLNYAGVTQEITHP